MPYIDRDNAGNVVGVYAVAQSEGQEFAEYAELWKDPKEALRSQIGTILSSRGLTQKWQVESAAASVLALALAEGLTEAQAYAQRPGYKEAKDLLVQIAALEAQL